MSVSDPFGPYRTRLLGLAYRMLGSRSEAEDVLQDAYLRIHGIDDIASRGAFLTTVVTRLCLDRLKSAKARRETYIGPWLPEPVADSAAFSPDAATELADDISFALLLALERLSPAERATFLLHDVFDVSFAQIAAMLERSEAACRQLATRARKSIRSARPKVEVDRQAHIGLLRAFGQAVNSGDLAAISSLFHSDAVLLSDGGGKKLTALNPIHGSDRIARFLIGSQRKFAPLRPDTRTVVRLVNGQLGVWTYADNRLDAIFALDGDCEGIAAIYIIRNPDKLTGLR